MFAFAILLLVLVFVPSLNVVVGGSARWLKVGPLPALHPAEIAKLAMIIYLAHWFAKRGTRIKGFWVGTIPFLIIVGPIVALVFKEPDLGTTMVIGLTAVTMFFLAGGRMIHLVAIGLAALVALVAVGLRAYQLDRIRTWLDPWSDPLGDRLPHDPGPARPRARRDPRGGARREPAGGRAVPAEREQRLHLRDHRRGVRADRRRRS